MRRQIFANTVGRICKLNLTLRLIYYEGPNYILYVIGFLKIFLSIPPAPLPCHKNYGDVLITPLTSPKIGPSRCARFIFVFVILCNTCNTL